MVEKLEPTCPKCGEGEPSMRYRGPALSRSAIEADGVESLGLTCRRCKYDWFIPTLNAGATTIGAASQKEWPEVFSGLGTAVSSAVRQAARTAAAERQGSHFRDDLALTVAFAVQCRDRSAFDAVNDLIGRAFDMAVRTGR